MLKIDPINTNNESLYVFPKSEEIVIDKSNLQIQLDKFKKRIKNTISIYDLIMVLSLWTPLFTADFKSLYFVDHSSIKAGYVVFSSIVTICIIIPKVFSVFVKDRNISEDSEEMARKILEQCQKK